MAEVSDELPMADAETIERRRAHGCSDTIRGASPFEVLARVDRACEAARLACDEARRSTVPDHYGSDPWPAEWPALARALHDVEQAAERGMALVAFAREMTEALGDW